MGEKLEKELLSKDRADIDVDRDYVRTLDSDGISYKQPMDELADVIITDYVRSISGSSRSILTTLESHETSITSNATSINSIEERICTSSELTTLEEMLGIEE